MAKISLRAYHREIETLIDEGHHDEALAHCGHILNIYSKCLDTYRLMGKVYLEAHRYQEAEDIFRRLLLAVPDDFIGNLGMSIVFDEAKNLNNAIWHMERAFEVQPSNTAVQGELRRLYGRRDGLEPPQIRLTRGALAQMYARGSQTQQAIAEIRSILAEEPDRTDMQVLLARVHFRGGQKVEASETCRELLKKYPYCLDANRIMVEVMADGSRSDTADIYRHRVEALDPYSQFASGSLFSVADVPDNAISIEKLDLDSLEQTGPSAPELATLAQTALSLSLGSESDMAPTMGALPPAGEVPAEEMAPGEIPDWLKAAGWGAATAEAARRAEQQAHEENMSPEAQEGATEELAAAEMPDWLQSLAPPGAPELDAGTDLESTDADMGWLAGLESAPAGEAGAESGVTQAGRGKTAAAVAAVAAALKHKDDEGDGEEGPPPAEQPRPSESHEEVTMPAVPEPEPSEEASGGNEALPDWMADMGDETAGPQGLGAIAGGLAIASMHTDEEPEGAEKPAQEPSPEGGPADVSAWLAGLDEGEAVAPAASPESAPEAAAQMSEDEAFAWLESLAAKQGAKPEELLTKPEERSETTPEWLAQAEPDKPEEGHTVAAAAVGAALGAALGQETESEEAAAETSEGEPGQQAAALEAAMGEEATESAGDDLGWLSGIEEGAPAEEPAAGVPSAPEWVADQPEPAEDQGEESLEARLVSAEEAVVYSSEVTEAEQDLSSSEASPGQETPEGEAQPVVEEMPDWLRASLEETPEPTESEPLPEWIAAAAVAEEVVRSEEPREEVGPDISEAAPEPGIEIARQIPPEGDEAIFEQAQIDLQRGNLDQAAAGYSRLIKRGRMLDEIIFDLREGTYRHPVDVIIWLTLGDAYKRANRLQEALDAYTKGEELLR